MNVVSLHARIVSIPLRKEIRHASHVRKHTENIVVTCTLADGTVGYGEGVPREYVTGESAETALHLLKNTDWQQLHAPDNFPAALHMLEHFTLPRLEGDERGCHGNAARCALELALLDAYGQHFRQPVSAITHMLTPGLFEHSDEVQYSGAITSARGFKAKLAGWKMWIYGFRQVKVKVGIEGYDDVARLKAIRSRLGRKIDVRIDANEAWTIDNIIAKTSELKPYGISSIEQPVPHEAIAELAAVKAQLGVPVMFDESLCSMADAERAVGDGLCDLFNIRLSKCGGFIRSLRLAEYAMQHGLGYQLGCQVGETAILTVAGRHFATSVKSIRALEGSYDRHLVKEALGAQDYTFGYAGKAPMIPGPGLGVEVDADALERVSVQAETLYAR